MAMQTILGGADVYCPPMGNASTFALSTGAAFSAASASAATMFPAPKSGNVRKVHWATRTVTTGATMEVRLETASTTANAPSGTLVGANTNNAAVTVNSTDDNVLFTTTLTADAAVTAGQMIAVVIKNPSSSPGNLQICATHLGGYEFANPYSAIDTGGAGTYSGDRLWHLCIALEYDDATIVPIMGLFPPCTAVGSSGNVNTGTTPDVVGMRFQIPFPARIAGCWLYGDFDGNYEVKLVSTAYNQGADTGVLARSGVIDSEYRNRATGGPTRLMFTSTYDLAANTNYRLVMEPTTATNCVLFEWVVGSVGVLDAFPGGRNFHTTTAKDPTVDGSWTNYNSGTFRRALMGLLLTGFDDAVSAGGSGAGSFAFAG